MLSPSFQKQLFASNDYVKFLRAMIEHQKKERGYRKQLAECAGCQQAYLSHVLSGNAQLTPEHAEALCRFWDLRPLESEFFFQLVQFKRAGTPALRERFGKRLAEIRAEWEKESDTYSKPNAGDIDRASVCYRTWKHSAVHILLTVPQMQKPQNLAKALQLDGEEVLEILNDLASAGLALATESGWQSTQAQIHTTQKDFFAEVHHRNWRLRALEARRHSSHKQIRYTMLHTLSSADYAKVCELIEQLIQDSRAVIEPSREELGACMILDYFPLKATNPAL